MKTAERLLLKVLDTGSFDAETLAAALVVSCDTLDCYLSGREPMPLDRQSHVATFVIEKVPRLAREGHRLRGQIQAALAFNSCETARHTEPPSRPWR